MVVLRRASRQAGRHALVLLALLVFCAGLAPTCRAEEPSQVGEYTVKAAFLFKFAGYIEWPPKAFADADAALTIGVIGADALADELARVVVGRNVGGHPVRVRTLRRGDPLTGLHVIFIGRGNAGRVAEVLSETKGQPTLTVTETDDGLALGSVINFVVVENKVRFDVALPPAEAQSLKISARLLAVARKVVAGPS